MHHLPVQREAQQRQQRAGNLHPGTACLIFLVQHCKALFAKSFPIAHKSFTASTLWHPRHLRIAKCYYFARVWQRASAGKRRALLGAAHHLQCLEHSYLTLFAFLSMSWAARQRVQQGKGACPAQLVLRLSLPGNQHPPLRLTLVPLSSCHVSALGLAAPTGRNKAKGLCFVCSSSCCASQAGRFRCLALFHC